MNTDRIALELADYGYSLGENSRIVFPGGKASDLFVCSGKAGRLQVRAVNGRRLLWSGQHIGSFLEAFWFAERHKRTEPGNAPEDLV
jgi:hypothetical protein